jgi:hypothetical protein
MIDTLPAEAQLIARPGQIESREHPVDARVAIAFPSRSPFKLHTLLLIFLTVAVVAWGYGDRLTRYKNDPDPLKRGLVARLWVDQQTNLRDVAAKLHTPPQSDLDQVLAVVAPVVLTNRFVEFVLSAPKVESQLATVSPLLPLRSPPSVPFLA